MVRISQEEESLNGALLLQPKRHNNRYSPAADRELRQILFRSLAGQRDDYFALLFPHGTPADDSEPWSLRNAQGAVDGAEYTAAAKGTACGHIFRSGESTYHCKTCAADETCVLCARCFEASDHEGHTVFISVSPGNSGCCDCGDLEAWRRPVACTIHSLDAEVPQSQDGGKGKAPAHGADLPVDLLEAIRMTIARAADYLCDVFSCSPEQLRLTKTVESIERDERTARLGGVYGSQPRDEQLEYALVLWNDEKHTVFDVETQVARACKQTKRFGYNKAMEVNDIGRSIIDYSTDLPDLLRKAEIIEHLKVTVTIRSARDTFREQMCETIIDWISDISGCAVGNDAHALRNIICEELLNPWRTGSPASNRDIGKDGLDDHEIEDNNKLRSQYRSYFRPLTVVTGTMAVNDEMDEDGSDEDGEDDEGDEEEVFEHMGIDLDDMDMEFDFRQAANTAIASAADGDMDIDFLDENEDMTETLEATIAGYPPPPPPPNPANRRRILTPADSDDGDAEHVQQGGNEPYTTLPRTPKVRGRVAKQRSMRPSKHWLEKPEGYKAPRPSEACEDIWQRVRLDFLILYDLRLWKVLRIHLRHLYITTVVTIPHFKRILGLRFAGLYTPLAQLYLIADREPDHSIINLSVQMLTTPTITEEVVERGNFLTNLMAILYTFLTTRQVGYPTDVSPTATLAFDAGAVTNRRMFHFFLDLRWLFQSEFIHERMRAEPRYLLQFVDLIKLHQGLCPNVRATAEHVEYESDAWIHASMIIKEVNKLCKQVATAFVLNPGAVDERSHLQRALRTVAQATMINSFGYERKRFIANELKEDLGWHPVGPFDSSGKIYSIANHIVQTEPMSFHHPLHYLLSWLIEDGKSMSRGELRSLLHFSPDDLRDPWNATRQSPGPKQLTPDELLCSLFEHPLRVCVWLAQMKAGMWVRNGITLRHQQHTYRSVSQRDVGYQRDILMVQAGLVLCGTADELPGERFLAQMIDRFQMTRWFKHDFSVVAGFEEGQQLEVIEDFFHLLVVALCERRNLMPNADGKKQHDKVLQHDIAHALCFKPLSFSDLASRVTEKVSDSDDFNRVLESMTVYRAPEGLSDTGTFELKPEYIELVDPYFAHYSRNHREEAENIYKKHMAKKTGRTPEEVVYEPTLEPIESGLFSGLAAFTSTPLFAQVVSVALNYAAGVRNRPNSRIQVTRIETFLHVVLHLIMIAVLEDGQSTEGFVQNAAVPQSPPSAAMPPSLISALVTLSGMEEYASCAPTTKHVLHKMQQRQPEKVDGILGQFGNVFDRSETGSPSSVSADDKEKKKQEALARQARVMAKMKEQQNSFLQNQGLEAFGDDFNDYDDMSVTEEPETIDQRKTWSFPTGTCIWCQEETDDQRLYGTFAYLGESSILRSTPADDVDFVQEVIDTPESLDKPADDIRPFGVAGKNKRMIKKTGPDGKVTESERQGLSKGFPHQPDNNAPVATTCGHIMHYSCFDLYMTNSYNRQRLQIARNHPEEMALKEFCCPLCKALGNTFLPIVWKAKECAHEHELHAAKSFGDWLLDIDDKYSADLSFLEGDAPPPYRLHPQDHSSFNNRAMTYVNNTFSPSIVADMSGLSLDNTPTTSSDQRRYPLRSGISFGRLFGTARSGHGSQSSIDSTSTMSPTTAPARPRSSELFTAYARMDETIFANGLCDLPGEDPRANPLEPLSRALGMSISAFEIAQRGTSSNVFATSLLADLSEQNLTHFRVLSETIESYLAVHVIRGSWSNRVAAQTARKREEMTARLFAVKGEGRMMGLGSHLFEEDVFLFFADWLALMAPDVAEAHGVLVLCLWAEVVKTLAVMGDAVKKGGMRGKDTSAARASSEFRATLQEVRLGDMSFTDEQLALLRHMLDKYALAFLRKSIVLMLVRYGLDFECPYNLDPAAPELQRLTSLLHLPTLDELFATFTTSPNLQHLTATWTAQARLLSPTALTLPHPAIFELLGLPKTYDTLTELITKHRCPTTGKDLTDPAICLLCGAVFCSQAVCCMRDKRHGGKGGCYQHMEAHGLKTGVFLNVRKCMVLFCHGPGKGTFVPAPFLDRFGETDPTLRRHQQLFLEGRRYERGVRGVWVKGETQSVISRRLEGDVNPGGWETL